jgi:hypothetical protein
MYGRQRIVMGPYARADTPTGTSCDIYFPSTFENRAGEALESLGKYPQPNRMEIVPTMHH